MATMIFNDTLEFEFNDYSRNTYFNGSSITSEGQINGILGANISTELDDFANVPITSIQIKKEDEIVYSLQDINATLASINEGYNGSNVYTNITLHFHMETFN